MEGKYTLKVFCVCAHIPFRCLGTWYSPSWAQGMGLKAHEIGEERWDKPFLNGYRSDLEKTSLSRDL